MTKLKIVVAALLFTLTPMASAEPMLDRIIEFSIDAPKDGKIDKGATPDGSYVTLEFHDNIYREVVQLQAYRIAGSRGFGEPIASVFSKIVAGMSERAGVAPTKPIRTLSYQGETLYLTTHLGVRSSDGSLQGITTVAYFAERGSWRKMILLIFRSPNNLALSDDQLMTRLIRLKYRPALTP